MAATKPTPKSPLAPSALTDTSTRKRKSVDLSLIDAQLDELFAAPEEKPTTDALSARADSALKTGTFQLLSHDQITVRPQVRQSFPDNEMLEMRESIRNLHEKGQGIEGTGILQALLVSHEADGFRLVAGERRFRASHFEKIEFLPCVVISAISEDSIRLLQLTENALRTPPPILEEAHAIKDAMAAEKLSIRDMARVLGKDKSFVEGRINLLKYPPDVQEMVSARADTLRHARHLAAVKDNATRQNLISAVCDEGIGEREVKRRISKLETEVANSNTVADVTKNKVTDHPSPTLNSASLLLDKALKNTREFLDTIGANPLNETEKQKARETRVSLSALLEELDKVLD